MENREYVKLAIDFSAGTLTAAAIKRQYGDGVFASVAALAAGGLVGVATDAALDILDDHTGVVTAVGDVAEAGIDAVTSLFNDWF